MKRGLNFEDQNNTNETLRTKIRKRQTLNM